MLHRILIGVHVTLQYALAKDLEVYGHWMFD
jgi:hypothetical protein